MKTKIWNYIRASNGNPVAGATINVYVYPVGGGTVSYAYIYPVGDESVGTTTAAYALETDSNGYFEFYVADLEESATYGYDFTRLFKITWVLAGVTSGALDQLQFFDVTNRPAADSSSKPIRNKMVSDYQVSVWQDHIDATSGDPHLQYLTTDGSKYLTDTWDAGASGKLIIPEITARSAGTLKLTSYTGVGIIVKSSGSVEIASVDINAGTIDGATLGGAVPCIGSFYTTNIDGGTLDDVTLGGDTPCAGTFSNILVQDGVVNAAIGTTTPHDATFLGGTFNTVAASAATITNLIATNATITNLLSPVQFTGAWVGVGSFTVDNIKLSGNTVSATNNSGINLFDNAGNGIIITDGGKVTMGPESLGAPPVTSATLTINDTTRQLRLQSHTSAEYFDFTVSAGGNLLLDGTGTIVYCKEILDMDAHAIQNIGSLNSYFSSDGELVVGGYCSATEYRIGSNIIIQVPDQNTFIGIEAGKGIAGGNFNTHIGSQSGYNLSSGNYNTSIGTSASYNLSTGNNNTAIGVFAGYSISSSDYNIFIGNEAGYLNTGSKNMFIGYQSGWNNTGHSNIFIGYLANWNDTTSSNTLWIHNDDDPIPLIYGNFSTNVIGLQTVTPRYTLDVNGAVRLTGSNTLLFGGTETSSPSACFYFQAGEGITLMTLGASAETIGFTAISNESVSSGAGSIKMCGGTGRDSTGFLKIYVDGSERYIPYFTTIDG